MISCKAAPCRSSSDCPPLHTHTLSVPFIENCCGATRAARSSVQWSSSCSCRCCRKPEAGLQGRQLRGRHLREARAHLALLGAALLRHEAAVDPAPTQASLLGAMGPAGAFTMTCWRLLERAGQMQGLVTRQIVSLAASRQRQQLGARQHRSRGTPVCEGPPGPHVHRLRRVLIRRHSLAQPQPQPAADRQLSMLSRAAAAAVNLPSCCRCNAMPTRCSWCQPCSHTAQPARPQRAASRSAAPALIDRIPDRP